LATLAPAQPLSSRQRAAPQTRTPELRFAAHGWRTFAQWGETARWDALAGWAAEPNPFHESGFLLAALRAFDPSGKVSLLCLEADGQLAGVLPVRQERSYYGRPLPHWRNWLHANAFLGVPLVARGFEQAFWRELLAWADDYAAGALFLHLAEMPLHGPLFGALRAVLVEQRRPAALVHRHERAMLRSGLSPQEYYQQSINKKRRKELSRLYKRLAERGDLVIERKADAAGIDAWLDEFLALERAGWKGQAGSALACQPETEALFRDAMREGARRGRLERLTLRLDGRAVAALISFLTPPGSFGFKTAYDETFARSSPGVFLQREFLHVLTNPAIAWCDSCAAPYHPMIEHFWRGRRPIGRISIAIGGQVRRSLFRVIAAAETGRLGGDIV
jgi:CelD/BcsL family acetyltransferase involved in cellulose biosynthesis